MAENNEKITAETTTSKHERRTSGTRYLKLSRLPTLQEVLDRRTRPPLDLFCFYIFLQRELSEDALDFWLDVQQHENLCKAYFKDLRRSGRSIQDEWPEFARYARANGTHFAPLLSLPSEPPSPSPASPDLGSPIASPLPDSTDFDFSRSPVLDTRTRRDTESHGRPAQHSTLSPTRINSQGQGGGIRQRDRPSTAPSQQMSLKGKRKSKAPTVIARDRAIEKNALLESAERIFYRYLFDGGEREIYLPPSLRVYNFPESMSGDVSPLIPDLFHAQKVYVFKALEQDAFPRFLRAKAFANLTPLGSIVRLVAATLDATLILPFLFAFVLLLSSYYSLSPLLFACNVSETTPFHFIRVREQYVRKLIAIRAGIIVGASVLLTVIFVVIFTVVPGHRL
ncbi:hypothetical protein LQV05_003343 [Cryptococcus neoformans]|nr:hypothetical protein LQV05_003343 [Cryptococcus neoformans]